MGHLARKSFEEYFAEEVYFNYAVDSCLDIINKQLIPEVIDWKLNPLIIFTLKLKSRLKSKAKYLIDITKSG